MSVIKKCPKSNFDMSKKYSTSSENVVIWNIFYYAELVTITLLSQLKNKNKSSDIK